MKILTPPKPARSDAAPDTEALEALIEEARRRARRRRRGYAAGALGAAAAALLGFYGFNRGGEASRPQARAERSPGATAALVRGDWRPARGFDGAAITALAIDGKDPDTLFATTGGGVVRSSDGGRSWRGLDTGRPGDRLDVLAVAAQDPRTVYAAGTGIVKSTDGGITWKGADAGLFGEGTVEERDPDRFVSSLTVDPSNPGVVYAGTWRRGVLKTTNGGASWRAVLLGPVGPVVVDPRNPDTVYAGATSDPGDPVRPSRRWSGVFKSRDGGESWQPVGLQGAYVQALALDPRHPETIYASTDRGGVVKSADGGASWRGAGLGGRHVHGLVLHPRERNRMYALDDGRISVTSNGGRAWSALDARWAPGTLPRTLALDPRDPETLYLGTVPNRASASSGVFKSADGGASWRRRNAGLTDASVSGLALDPRSPGTAYAAVRDRGLFKREGGRWRPVTTQPTRGGAQLVAVDPIRPTTIYAGTHDGVFKSTNAGAGWRASLTEPFRGDIGQAVSALAVDPRAPSTVYAIATNADLSPDEGHQSRLYKSSNGGVTWPLTSEVQHLDIAGAPFEVWAQTAHDPPLAIDPLQPQTLYAGGLGVSKSVDGGATWRTTGLPRTAVLALAVDPGEPARVHAGTEAGLFSSTNGGESWRATEGPLGGLPVEALAIDPRRGAMYAGTDRGVFWSVDDGRSWHRFRRLPSRPFHALAVDPTADIVYAGSLSSGLFELEVDR